jgi:hypothetical protein
MNRAALSPIMMVGAFVLPETSRGMIEASATRKPSTPRTLTLDGRRWLWSGRSQRPLAGPVEVFAVGNADLLGRAEGVKSGMATYFASPIVPLDNPFGHEVVADVLGTMSPGWTSQCWRRECRSIPVEK